MVATLCSKQSIAKNDHLTFQCVIDCWGMCLAILTMWYIATHGFSNHKCVTKSKQTSRRKT